MSEEKSGASADQETSAQKDQDEAEPNLFNQPEGVDWFLSYLIWLADGFSLEQGITLTVGGSMLTGALISGRTYFEELGTLLKGIAQIHANDLDAGRSILDTLTKSYSQFSQVYEKPEAGGPYPFRKTAYIHLRNARIVKPEGIVPTPGSLWRGKLSDVAGFMLGELQRS
jgi:hypothetical protein